MRKLIFTFMACLCLGACSYETSDNGKLDGFWQLKQMDSLHNNVTVDMRDSGIYWAVQMRLLEISNGKDTPVFFRFKHTTDSLFIFDPYLDSRDQSDIKVTDPTLLRPFGIHQLSDSFAIRTLTGSNMILESKTRRLYFRKY